VGLGVAAIAPIGITVITAQLIVGGLELFKQSRNSM
jgi:hypothetical protein